MKQKPYGFRIVRWLMLIMLVGLLSNESLAQYLNATAAPGHNLFVRQLSGGTSNNLESLVDPSTLASGMTVFTVKSNGFVAHNYLQGWPDTNTPVAVGEAWFLKNPFATNVQVTSLGVVNPLGYFTNHLPAGLSVSGFLHPFSGSLTNYGFPAVNGDKVFLLTNGTANYATFTYANGWLPAEPEVAQMQGMWIQKSASVDWLTSTNTTGLTYTPSVVTGTTGQMNFFTYNATNASLGRVYEPDGITPVSTNYVGQLYAGTNSNEAAFTPLGSPVSFMGGSFSGYIRGGAEFVPFATGGQVVWVQLRVWAQTNGNSYEAALTNAGFLGKSAVLPFASHAAVENGLPGLPPNNVNIFASFSIGTTPEISSQPQSQTNLVGSSATFSLIAMGSPPLSYQWRFNGTSIGGATTTNYTINSVQLTNAGSYDVVVANSSGSVTSSIATLTVVSLNAGKLPNGISTVCLLMPTFPRATALHLMATAMRRL